ncbi:MAG: hypothetical protein ABI317_04745, partial [Gaiellales bacterium]
MQSTTLAPAGVALVFGLASGDRKDLSVNFGIAMFVTDRSVGPHDLGWLIEQHEALDSFFVPE